MDLREHLGSLILLIAALMFIGCSTNASDLDISDVDLSSFQISVSVDGANAPQAVRAGITAIDENRNTVVLSPSDVRIYESKDREDWKEVTFQCQRRSEAQIPISAAVCMDYSGSMDEQERQDSEEAVIAFSYYLLTNDRMAIIKFANEVKVLQDFTSDKDKIADAVDDNLSGFQLGTAVWDAADKGVSLADDENAPKAVIVTSDGEDNMSETKASELVDHAVKKGVPIFTIGFTETPDSAGLKYLYKVSEETGGLFYEFQSTEQMKGIYSAIAEAFDEALVATWPSTQSGGTVYIKVVVDTGSGESKSAVTAYSF